MPRPSSIGALRKPCHTSLVVVFAILYVVLLTIIARADRILQQQYQELEDARLSRLKRFFSLQMAEDDPPETHRR